MQKTFLMENPEDIDKEVNEFCKDKIIMHKVVRTDVLTTSSKSKLYIFVQVEYKDIRETNPQVKI